MSWISKEDLLKQAEEYGKSRVSAVNKMFAFLEENAMNKGEWLGKPFTVDGKPALLSALDFYGLRLVFKFFEGGEKEINFLDDELR